MDFKKYYKVVNMALTNNIPLLVVSGPGEGKTQTSRQIAESRNSDFIVINAANRHPFHISGLPVKADNHFAISEKDYPMLSANQKFIKDDNGILKADFAQYPFMQRIYGATEELIVIIDDLLLATNLLQGALMNLIEERSIDGRKIPDCVRFIITTNEAGQNAGGSGILSPLINRAIIVKFPRDYKAWLAYALSEGISKEILLFIHAFPHYLYSDSYPKGIKAFPSPRSWIKCDPFIKGDLYDKEILSGLVGEKAATDAVAFFRSLKKFGNLVSKVLGDPDNAPLYYNISDIYGCLLILSNHFEKKNVANIVRYFKRLDKPELLTVLMNLGCQNFPDSKQTQEYIDLQVSTSQESF